MSETRAGIALRVQQIGAEGVRARLREINAELRAGQPATKGLKDEVRDLTATQSLQNRVLNLSNQSWKLQHTNLMATARIMSTVASVARSVLAITTAFSVASIAFGKNNSQLVEAESQLARAQRELVAAIQSGDPERISRASEEVNVFTARVKELNDQKLQDMATNLLNVGASMALIGSSAIKAVPEIRKYSEALRGLGAAGWIALGPALAVAGAIGGIVLAVDGVNAGLTGNSALVRLLVFWPEAAMAVGSFASGLNAGFLLMSQGFQKFWDGVIGLTTNAVNTLMSGIETLANGFIATINGMISAYNSVAAVLRLPMLAGLAQITLPRLMLPVTAAVAAGGGISRGSGAGDITPFAQVTRASSGGGGTTIIVHNHIAGSMVTMDEVADYTRDRIKGKLRELNYTGY